MLCIFKMGWYFPDCWLFHFIQYNSIISYIYYVFLLGNRIKIKVSRRYIPQWESQNSSWLLIIKDLTKCQAYVAYLTCCRAVISPWTLRDKFCKNPISQMKNICGHCESQLVSGRAGSESSAFALAKEVIWTQKSVSKFWAASSLVNPRIVFVTFLQCKHTIYFFIMHEGSFKIEVCFYFKVFHNHSENCFW